MKPVTSALHNWMSALMVNKYFKWAKFCHLGPGVGSYHYNQYTQFLSTVDWHKKSDRQTIRQYKLKLNKQNVNLNKVKMDF